MSFNALVSGADCGPVNPLAQMVKHTDADRSLQKDRIGPQASGSRLQHLPPSAMNAPSAADAAMARQFFEANAAPGMPMQQIAPFQAPPGVSVNRSMTMGPAPQGDGGAGMHAAWSRTGGAHSPEALNEAWSRGASSSHTPVHLEQPGAQVSQIGGPAMSMGMAPLGMGMGMYSAFGPQRMMTAPPLMSTTHSPQPQLDWDSEFSRVADQDVKGKGKAIVSDVVDLEARFKELSANEVRDDGTGKHADYMSEFEKVWSQMKLEGPTDPTELAQWESQYQQVLQGHREEIEGLREGSPDYAADIRRAWETQNRGELDSDFGLGPQHQQDGLHFDEVGIPNLPAYVFEPNNPNLALPGQELLARAKEYLANNGSLSEAALLFEAAIQKGELGEGGYEAWILLGETRSMDEREDIGLLALRQGVQIAKAAGHIGPGMLSLAVSYTNEAYEQASNTVLKEWLLAKYPSARMPPSQPSSISPWHSREVAKAGFIDIAQTLHAQGQSDPDLQVGLGVLYYSDGEYDKAKDCFEAALWSRPEDYLLWNRLGSCLSNGNKPEEALNVYREALRLRPTYTRAIFNVGVACLNIGAHKEAAEHFLSALSIQKTATGGVPPPDSTEGKNEQLWKTLKKAFTLMGREDLALLTDRGDIEAFRGQFDF